MVHCESIRFEHTACLRLSNDEAELVVSVGIGPRVLSFRRHGGVNFMKLFADQFNTPNAGEWHSYGGHRLWHAPERFPRTYYPDNQPVEHTFADGVLTLRGATETSTGLEKEITIKLAGSGTRVELGHRIYNRNPWAVEFAPWCLTVMAPGGRALIPQEPYVPHGSGPGESFAPARPLVLWQFTRMNDPRFQWGDRLVIMREDGKCQSKQKIGMTNRPGWAAYELGRELFVKRFPYDPAATYPDGGCNCEFFTMPGFLEIESLGPLAAIEPEGFALLNESWELHPFAPSETEPELVWQLRALGLEV